MSLSRRLFLQQLAASGLLLAGCQSGDKQQSNSGTGGTPVPKRPNVLMIIMDDLNDWVGYMGTNPQVLTPNMDRLAASGVQFTRAYCNAPLCNPSRASVLTGLMPSRTGVTNNDMVLRNALPNALTMPQHFKANGYTTFGTGKVFHHPDVISWTKQVLRQSDPLPATLPASNKWCSGSALTEYKFDWAPLNVPDSDMSDSKVADTAINFLAAEQNKPFFMSVGFVKPHAAWYVPKKYFDLYPRDSVMLPEILATDRDDLPNGAWSLIWQSEQKCVVEHDMWRDAVQAYLASITFADVQVGRVLDALAASAYADNTIVVLWSDNGYHLGEKLYWHKSALWEKTIRVPFIIALPKSLAKGKVVTSGVELLDIFPTLTDYCALPTPEGLQGQSLRPLIANPEMVWNKPVLTIFNKTDYSLRDGKWRYIRYANGDEELYDHDTDEKEWYNLALNPAFDQVKTELKSKLSALI